MLKPLLPLTFPPGLYQNGTVYESKGRYYDSDLVRFHQSTIRPVGGWRTPNGGPAGALTGKPRTMTSYRLNVGTSLVGVGTTSKLYVITAGVSHDVTPSGFTTFRVDGSYSSGGAYGKGPYGRGKYGTGAVVPTVRNPDTWSLDNFGQYMLAVPTSDHHIYLWSGNTAVVAALVPWSEMTWTGTVQTSGSTTAGTDTIVLTSTTLVGTLRVGEQFTLSGTKYTVITADVDAVANVVTVKVQPTVPATVTTGTAISGHTEQTPLCQCAFVTPEFIVMALGAESVGRRVKWSDQAEISIWGALADNQAGDFDVPSRGSFLTGRRGKDQSLLWTDCDMWTATYTGDAFVYRFSQAGDNCGLMGPNAVMVSDGRAIWMSNTRQFFSYDGFVKPIPCEVADGVFGDFSILNAHKTYCVNLPQYGEVWWFYCSSSATECDRAVVFNYNEQHWTLHHSIPRNAGMAAGATAYAWMVDSSGYLWEHEVPGVNDRGGATPYLESGPIELGSGDRTMTVDGLVPDDKTLGDVSVSIYGSFYPDDAETLYGPFTLTSPTYFRMKARQVRVRFQEVTADDWRVGTVRLSAKEGSRR